MRGRHALVLLLICSLITPIVGKQSPSSSSRSPSQQTSPQSNDGDEVVTVTTNLVQVDAVVTDKNGDAVTDLTSADFEITEDGKPQPITNFSYVSLTPPPSAASAPVAEVKTKDTKNAAPAPSFRTLPGGAQRTIAFVASDLSPLSADTTRAALKRYVDEMMQPNDLAGIFRISGGAGALQQFTSDKRQLHRAISKVRYLPRGGDPGDALDAARSDYTVKAPRGESLSLGARTFEDARTREQRGRDDSNIRGIFDDVQLAVLFFLVNDLQKLPGRKAIVLFSNGIELRDSRTLDRLNFLIDLANRASVTIYTMDARGVIVPGGINAEDEVLPDGTGSLRQRRSDFVFHSRNGLFYLANETGGLFKFDSNDLSIGLRSVLKDQSGYYLIGYRPSEQTFARAADKFRRIKVSVKRPGLRVRSRSGFFGTTDKLIQQQPRTGDKQLYAVLASPLAASGIRLRLTSLHGKPPGGEAFTRALLHINPQDISFTEEGGGQKKISLDVAAVTFRNDSKILEEFTRAHTVRVNDETHRHIARHGLAYAIDVPAKEAGAYQLRVVVRDNSSGRIGSASEFIEVPRPGRDETTISSIFLRDLKDALTPVAPVKISGENALSPVASLSAPALRVFKVGDTLSYGYWVYNAPPRDAKKQRQLTAQVRLFRDGEIIFTRQEEKLVNQQPDPNQFSDQGFFKLTPQTSPGEYTLQVIVNEIAVDGDRDVITQSVDFTVVG